MRRGWGNEGREGGGCEEGEASEGSPIVLE